MAANKQLVIVYRRLSDLRRNPDNAKNHPPEQIAQLRTAYQKWGYISPLLIKPDLTIGAGHGRLDMAEAEGLLDVPTITMDGLTDEDWRALVLADNRIASNGTWNEDLLRSELNALKGFGFNVTDMGFGDMELGALGVDGFALPTRIERAEETPEPPKVAKVKLGELWILGAHRLLIGDSTNAKDVARLLQGGVSGKPPNLMVTDPPYGVNYDPNWRNEADRANGKSYGARAVGQVSNDGQADWTEAWRIFPGDVAYVWHAGLHARTVQESLEKASFEMRSQIVWVKDRLIISRGDYHWKHEPCWYAVRKGKKGCWAGDRKQTTVWEIAHRKSETGHGTQKPIECMRRPIINNSKPGDGVYDPFCGSGTTLIACEMEKRHCFAVELDPVYAEVIIERWQAFAGGTAKREDGVTFGDLSKPKQKPKPAPRKRQAKPKKKVKK